MRIIQTALKTKWIGSVLLLLSMLTLVQCSSDDESPEVLTINGTKINLKNAKIYLSWQDEYNGYIMRDYIITDGTPTEVDSWSVEDYTGATYLIAVELGTQAESFSSGTFPVKSSWSTVIDNISYIYYEVPSEGGALEYDTPSDEVARTVKVKGNFEDGDNISFSFSGTLWDESEEVLVPTKVNLSGTIVDLRQ